MRRALMVMVLVLLFGCREEPYGPPEMGAQPGPVQLRFEGEVAPNERVSIHVDADDATGVLGSGCFEIYRWQPGWGPEVDWVVDAQADRTHRVNSIEVSCPAMGVRLPTTFSVTIPELDEGTHLLSYHWTNGDGQVREDSSTASYVFAVDG